MMVTWFVLSDDHPANVQPVAPNSRTFVIHDLELERHIRTKIEREGALKATIDVTAQAAKNEATRSGVVASERFATEPSN
jgi:hypothetical protein